MPEKEHKTEIEVFFLEKAPDLPEYKRKKLNSKSTNKFSLSKDSMRLGNRVGVNNPELFPFSAICLLAFYTEEGFVGNGTGFFVAPSVVVTAAHNLTRTRPKKIGVHPGFDFMLNKSQDVGAWRYASHPTRDLAVILTPPIPQQTVVHPQGVGQGNFALVGYSQRYTNGTYRLTRGIGPGRAAGQVLRYAIWGDQGDSGGPVFAGDASSGVVAAIHTFRHENGESSGEFVTQDFEGLVRQLVQAARNSAPLASAAEVS